MHVFSRRRAGVVLVHTPCQEHSASATWNGKPNHPKYGDKSDFVNGDKLLFNFC